MRVSFTDQWQTLFDENGKPLVGRVKFMKADASQFKPVYYDNNGTQTLAPNPCYTLQDGRLEHQIFLDYGMYTCIVEKFIGEDSSNMTDYADNTDYWSEYKRFKAYGGEDRSSGTANIESGFVDTIADLRLVDPSEHGIVSVVGYYSKEDGIEPRTYVWVPDNEDAEDFGSTIISSLSGYTNAGTWKLCNSPIVCATTFGVFPDRKSTITPSDLTTKATALAEYARVNKVCTAIQFNRGKYEFAEGARLSFTKKVITGASVVAGATIKFGMHVEEGVEPTGTIEIAFIGGLELEQKSPICSNDYDSYVTFSFGAGVVRTSWLQTIEKHIIASRPYEGLTIILDKSSTQTFYSNGQAIKNWHFKGCDKAFYQVIGGGALFHSCSFEGKCFQVNNARFHNCGTLYQECICANDTKITDDVIWSAGGHIKSEGTTFVCNDIRMTKAYIGVVDNSCIKAIGEDAKIVSTFPLTFKYLDRDWQLHGEIGFENSDTLYASRYANFADCVDYAQLKTKTINLESGSYSYTIDVEDVSVPRIFAFKNGTLNLTKTGTSSVKDTISLDRVAMTGYATINNVVINGFSSTIAGLYSADVDLILNDCVLNATDLNVYHCDAVGTTFNGQIYIHEAENVFTQRFTNCVFDKPIVLMNSGTSTIVNIKVEECVFSINNQGSQISAISLTNVNSASVADETYNKYKIEDNVFYGDAFLLPQKKVMFNITSSTDGTSSSSVLAGELSQMGLSTNRNDFYAKVTAFARYSFAEKRIFHFGSLHYVLKAKPLTQGSFYYPQGDSNDFVPMCDYVQGTEVGMSPAIYRVFGNTITPPELQNFYETIEWLVEIERV